MSDNRARLDEMVSEHPAIKYAMYRPTSRDRQQALEAVALDLLAELDEWKRIAFKGCGQMSPAGLDNALRDSVPKAKLDQREAEVAALARALILAKDAADEQRGYAQGWDWKYGSAWDEEDAEIAGTLNATATAAKDFEDRVRREEREAAWERAVKQWPSMRFSGRLVKAAIMGGEGEG